MLHLIKYKIGWIIATNYKLQIFEKTAGFDPKTLVIPYYSSLIKG